MAGLWEPLRLAHIIEAMIKRRKVSHNRLAPIVAHPLINSSTQQGMLTAFHATWLFLLQLRQS